MVCKWSVLEEGEGMLAYQLFFLSFFSSFNFFGHTVYGILVPQPWDRTHAPAVKVKNLNHWTTREVQHQLFLTILYTLLTLLF